jgi:SAM-dependent methyltransferase
VSAYRRETRRLVGADALPGLDDPCDATLAAYGAAAQRYLRESARPGPSLIAYPDRFSELIGGGHVLELGSGPGWDADHLEGHGVRVTRSDATPRFADLLRAAGHEAVLIDARGDDFGGPYDGVLADAVLFAPAP